MTLDRNHDDRHHDDHHHDDKQVLFYYIEFVCNISSNLVSYFENSRSKFNLLNLNF
jgi:hypothetical protein